jgi:hypothetical protein
VECPIIAGIYKVIHENADARAVVSETMSRELRAEVDPELFEAAARQRWGFVRLMYAAMSISLIFPDKTCDQGLHLEANMSWMSFEVPWSLQRALGIWAWNYFCARNGNMLAVANTPGSMCITY